MSNRQTGRQPGRKKLSFSSLIILILLGIAFYFASGNLPGQKAEPASQPVEAAAGAAEQATPETPVQARAEQRPGEKDTVFAYLKAYGRLPDYYITKNAARKLGWEGGGLEDYAPGRMIGGDRFGNFEGLLPKKPGRGWTEADIGTMGKSSRGAERIVFSSDGLIYFTKDHYESFEKLGEAD